MTRMATVMMEIRTSISQPVKPLAMAYSQAVTAQTAHGQERTPWMLLDERTFKLSLIHI